MSNSTERELGKMTEEFANMVYKKGFEDGCQDTKMRVGGAYEKGYKEGIESMAGKNAYKKGLDDAWECARKLAHSRPQEEWNIICKLFKVAQNRQFEIFERYSASEAIEIFRASEIEVGDEVQSFDTKYVVVKIDKDKGTFEGFGKCGVDMSLDLSKYERTGRHFPLVEEILDKIMEDQE